MRIRPLKDSRVIFICGIRAVQSIKQQMLARVRVAFQFVGPTCRWKSLNFTSSRTKEREQKRQSQEQRRQYMRYAILTASAVQDGSYSSTMLKDIPREGHYCAAVDIINRNQCFRHATLTVRVYGGLYSAAEISAVQPSTGHLVYHFLGFEKILTYTSAKGRKASKELHCLYLYGYRCIEVAALHLD